ncbi:MAG: hypothetical protein WCO64_08140 [Actinomycetes bacterium]
MSTVAKPVKLGNTRVTGKEQFYTPPDTAAWVVDRVLATIPNTRKKTWLEPSAGTGAFIDALAACKITDVIGIDIEPHHRSVVTGDFLSWTTQAHGMVAVGNPPFGRNNALSIPFFNHAATMCDVIAFIVPRSWRKWSVTNRLDRSFQLIVDEDLSINYVNVAGVDVYGKNNLQTCLQIWKKSTVLRDLVKVPDSVYVSKSTPQNADIAMRVFGYGCGTVLTEFPRVPNTTMMYLELIDPRALDALREIDFAPYYTNVAYTPALAFSEIRFALDKYFATC